LNRHSINSYQGTSVINQTQTSNNEINKQNRDVQSSHNGNVFEAATNPGPEDGTPHTGKNTIEMASGRKKKSEKKQIS